MIDPYTVGSDITIDSSAAVSHLALYEVDAAGNIVKFSLIKLEKMMSSCSQADLEQLPIHTKFRARMN